MNSNNKKINIWDLGNKINVKVNKSFIDFVNEKIKEKYKTKRNIHKELIKYYNLPFSVFKNRMKRGYKYFVDLEILLNSCKTLEIPLEKLQNNIVAYKTRRSHNCLIHPKLPIEITPIFDMLIAHHIADGCLIKIDGKQLYFSYKQCDKKIRLLYKKKLESLFGEIYHKKEYYSKSMQVYCPAVFTTLFFRMCSLKPEEYFENLARVPKEIFHKDSKNKLAFLLGIILDEGHIDSDLMVIGLKNGALLEDLKRICEDLNYKTSLKKDKRNEFHLYIKSESLSKFYNDYKNLLKKYPEINLCYKEKKIVEFIKRRKKQKLYRPGNKPIIIKELSCENLTVNEIAQRLNMTRQGARYLVNELIKENKIEVKSVVKYGSYNYGLKGA